MYVEAKVCEDGEPGESELDSRSQWLSLGLKCNCLRLCMRRISSLIPAAIISGVSFGQMSLKGDGLMLSFRVVGGELDGDTHIGTHLWRLEGLPWP